MEKSPSVGKSTRSSRRKHKRSAPSEVSQIYYYSGHVMRCCMIYEFLKLFFIAFQQEWSLFYFGCDNTMHSVPSSWVERAEAGHRDLESHSCYWPEPGSKDDSSSRLYMLISRCSEPDREEWSQRYGVRLGTFDRYDRSEKARDKYSGLLSSSDSELHGDLADAVNDVRHQLNGRRHKRSRQSKRREDDGASGGENAIHIPLRP